MSLKEAINETLCKRCREPMGLRESTRGNDIRLRGPLVSEEVRESSIQKAHVLDKPQGTKPRVGHYGVAEGA